MNTACGRVHNSDVTSVSTPQFLSVCVGL